jgi:hypothetical protein
MSQNATELRLEDFDIKPYLITKLKNAGIESIFDLAISIPHELYWGNLFGADKRVTLDLVLKTK